MDKAEKSGLPEWESREENGSERSKGLRGAKPLYLCCLLRQSREGTPVLENYSLLISYLTKARHTTVIAQICYNKSDPAFRVVDELN